MRQIVYIAFLLILCSNGGCGKSVDNKSLHLLNDANKLIDFGNYEGAKNILIEIDTTNLNDSMSWACSCLWLNVSRFENIPNRIRFFADRCYRHKRYSSPHDEYDDVNYFFSMSHSFGVEGNYCKSWTYLDSAITDIRDQKLPLGMNGAQGILNQLLISIGDTATLSVRDTEKEIIAQKFCGATSTKAPE